MSIIEQLGASAHIFALTLPAIGSAFGSGAAGMAALGAWKKAALEDRPPPVIIVAFVGAPLSQVIYGMILMNQIRANAAPEEAMTQLMAGTFGGVAMALSAWFQGKAGALAADFVATTGKGFANAMMALGVIETVALFVMVFLLAAM